MSTDDGAILLGYHTATTNLQGVRAQTISSAKLTAVRLNGTAASEAALSSAVAGQFGVPVILVTGDSEVVKETQRSAHVVQAANAPNTPSDTPRVRRSRDDHMRYRNVAHYPARPRGRARGKHADEITP